MAQTLRVLKKKKEELDEELKEKKLVEQSEHSIMLLQIIKNGKVLRQENDEPESFVFR